MIDGDTIILDNGAHLRLIGLDTPEIDHTGGASEAGALAARAHLAALIGKQSVSVLYGRQRRDHYQRRLGHLFLPDGRNIQALLLRQGLATPLIIPPNLGFLDCYRMQAETAMRAGAGLWGLPAYQPVNAADLREDTRGYRLVTGTVSRIGESRSSLWINLGDNFALRIMKTDLVHFDKTRLRSLTGKSVQARGRVYRRSRQLRLRLRHPGDLKEMSGRRPLPP